MSNGKKLLIILILSCSVEGFGVLLGLSFSYIYALAFALPAGALAFLLFRMLLKDFKSKNEKTTRWYTDKYIAMFVPVWITAALVIIAFSSDGSDTLLAAGFLMFPVASIAVAPNGALLARKNLKNWEQIFYGKGNLHKLKDTEDFYPIEPPLPYEKRILLAALKNCILNIGTIAVMAFVISVSAILRMVYDSYHETVKGDLFASVAHVKAERAEGFMFFAFLFVMVFGFPIFTYFVSDAINKLRLVSAHKYLAYHAIVKSVKNYVLLVDHKGRHYKYNYATLIGMSEKKIKDTPATLVFLPDDVLIFPDKQ